MYQHFIINYSFLVLCLSCFRTFSQVKSFLVLKLLVS
uniref:PRO0189 n=1 Tax=Homo sapiens TaxID=9606 RepID=Q9UI80_HUMAN|nr:PRO0189 [Homo sapiens]